MDRIRDNDLAFAALPLAYKKAERKRPRLLARFADAAPESAVELWLEEMEVRPRAVAFKCKLTSAWIALIPAAARFCTELHVEFTHGAHKFEGTGRLAAVGRGGPMEGYFSLWLPNRHRRQHVEIVDPEILEDGRLWRGQRKGKGVARAAKAPTRQGDCEPAVQLERSTPPDN
ncbi:hypothetical protein [Variovorax saccharolyticus]|uniref:hypothetical protein n=1 Tax=Variovorax saccharolyticus TaxID=3053516 RepID=UPI0025781C0A|nr:hypothetical protein [Variovorax sp. J31P216]MDM0029113.1 hypothetical protein [Variovorax sp. J31P216]